jgi:hypothetical protein
MDEMMIDETEEHLLQHIEFILKIKDSFPFLKVVFICFLYLPDLNPGKS